MNILMVTGIEGAGNCAAQVKAQLDTEVEVAGGRKQALAALRQREFSLLIVDDSLAECDPAGAEAIWERAGLAIPLQINFALSGTARLIREIRAALHRREREQAVARRAAAEEIDFALKDAVSGLWLHSQLALSQSGLPVQAADKIRVVVDLADALRRQLSEPARSRRETPG